MGLSFVLMQGACRCSEMVISVPWEKHTWPWYTTGEWAAMLDRAAENSSWRHWPWKVAVKPRQGCSRIEELQKSQGEKMFACSRN